MCMANGELGQCAMREKVHTNHIRDKKEGSQDKKDETGPNTTEKNNNKKKNS